MQQWRGRAAWPILLALSQDFFLCIWFTSNASHRFKFKLTPCWRPHNLALLRFDSFWETLCCRRYLLQWRTGPSCCVPWFTAGSLEFASCQDCCEWRSKIYSKVHNIVHANSFVRMTPSRAWKFFHVDNSAETLHYKQLKHPSGEHKRHIPTWALINVKRWTLRNHEAFWWKRVTLQRKSMFLGGTKSKSQWWQNWNAWCAGWEMTPQNTGYPSLNHKIHFSRVCEKYVSTCIPGRRTEQCHLHSSGRSKQISDERQTMHAGHCCCHNTTGAVGGAVWCFHTDVMTSNSQNPTNRGDSNPLSRAQRKLALVRLEWFWLCGEGACVKWDLGHEVLTIFVPWNRLFEFLLFI